jgi:hypothetical protein
VGIAVAVAVAERPTGYTLCMSLFRVNVVARNPKDESRETLPIEALVDTGSELTWLPAGILAQAGIVTRRKRTFLRATRQSSAFCKPTGFRTTGSSTPNTKRSPCCDGRSRDI